MYVKHGKLNHEKFSHLFEFYNIWITLSGAGCVLP